jgi:hypothetical protein
VHLAVEREPLGLEGPGRVPGDVADRCRFVDHAVEYAATTVRRLARVTRMARASDHDG